MLAALLKDKEIGKRIVPIIPDEARTFGIDLYFEHMAYTHIKGRNMILLILINIYTIKKILKDKY